MKIREETERIERANLHPLAAFASESKGRNIDEPQCPIRTVFQRDRDRIIHSKAFRRLKHKTQVFLAQIDDHYRTRLTHTLEVAQIGRTIARALRLNEDLTEAIALAHDLGHTPFGHSGEAALNEVTSDEFHHSDQSLRVVDKLEKNGKGLNLTWEVRDGIVKHSKGMRPISEFSSEELPSTLEGQVMRIADIIAYINHDIDDALRAGLIKRNELPSSVLKRLGDSHAKRIDTIVRDVIDGSLQVEMETIFISADVVSSMDELRIFLSERVYNHLGNREEFQKGKRIIKALYEYFIANPDVLNDYYDLRTDDLLERRVIDLIAGMTDRYAIRVFKNLFIPFS